MNKSTLAIIVSWWMNNATLAAMLSWWMNYTKSNWPESTSITTLLISLEKLPNQQLQTWWQWNWRSNQQILVNLVTYSSSASTFNHDSRIVLKWNLSIPPKPLTMPTATFCFRFLGFIRFTYWPMQYYTHNDKSCHTYHNCEALPTC